MGAFLCKFKYIALNSKANEEKTVFIWNCAEAPKTAESVCV